jgi:Flp pilus assembly protein TadD
VTDRPSVVGLFQTALAVTLVMGGAALADPAVTDVPGHPPAQRTAAAFMRAGDLAMADGEVASAIAFYQRAADLAPKDAAPDMRLGEALAKSGAVAAAFEAYGEAHIRDPRSASIDLALGRLALTLGRPQEAMRQFEAAGRQHEDAAVWNGMGVAQDALGDHAAAQQDYRKGLALKPADASLRNNLGLSLALAGQYPAAIATLSELAAEPGAQAGERLNLALVYGLSGDDEKAAQAARGVLGEADNAANRKSYALLRAMDDRSRTRAILGVGDGDAEPISNSRSTSTAPPPK